MRGKDKCRILKEIRQRIADENDIPLVTQECAYRGECTGTCPRCEAELRWLEDELEERQAAGEPCELPDIDLLFPDLDADFLELLETPDCMGLIVPAPREVLPPEPVDDAALIGRDDFPEIRRPAAAESPGDGADDLRKAPPRKPFCELVEGIPEEIVTALYQYGPEDLPKELLAEYPEFDVNSISEELRERIDESRNAVKLGEEMDLTPVNDNDEYEDLFR